MFTIGDRNKMLVLTGSAADVSGQRYVLDLIDSATRCVVNDSGVHRFGRFCELLELDLADIEPGASYELDALDVAEIMHALGRNCEEGRLSGLLRPWCLTDQLPYKVHTNRELVMMLEGTKPLAVFSDSYPSTLPPFEVIPDDVFAPHVESGRFVSREVIVPPKDPARDLPRRIVCYALPTERWRIDAYLLLLHVGG